MSQNKFSGHTVVLPPKYYNFYKREAMTNEEVGKNEGQHGRRGVCEAFGPET